MRHRKDWLNVSAAVLLPLIYGICLALPGTRFAARRLLAENQPVELLTFVFLLAAGVVGLALAAAMRRQGEPIGVWGFFAAFAAAALFVAGEEVAWGQWFVAFETPGFFRSYNRQGMLTLHNLPGIDSRSEIIRVAFGAGGLVGLTVAAQPAWHRIAPGRELLPWFAVIFALALMDFVNDLTVIEPAFDLVINALSELVEMMIGVAALLYVWLKWKEVRR